MDILHYETKMTRKKSQKSSASKESDLLQLVFQLVFKCICCHYVVEPTKLKVNTVVKLDQFPRVRG